MREKSRTILLVDDHDVLYRSGTERVVSAFDRCPENPLIPAYENPWETAIGWTSVYRDPGSGKYQLWYQSYTGDRMAERTQDCVVCYAESDDGIHFTKPMLDLFPFEGESQTNIVMVGSGGYSYRYGNAVVVDENPDEPSKRYKMSYFDWGMQEGQEYPGLHVAFSEDGIHWNKHREAPLSRMAYGKGTFGGDVPYKDDASEPWLIPLSMSDVVDAMWDPVRRVYAIYGKMWIDSPEGGMFWKHAMGRIESEDFVSWSQPELVLAPNDQDPPHVEFHTSPVFYHAGRYFSLKQILDRGDGGGTINIELAVSVDGLAWERPFQGRYVLPRGSDGQFDSGSIFTNATPVVLDDEIRFYYGAYSGGATSVDDRGHLSGVGMATIRRDRFAGVRSSRVSGRGTHDREMSDVGQVTLKAVDLGKADSLTVNADAGDGQIRVELLDTTGRRVPGFGKEDAVPLTGDSLRHDVTWKQAHIRDLDGDCLIRIHLERAALYAIDVS